MNNGRPNYGNAPGWGNGNQQGQQAGYGQQNQWQTGYWQQPQQDPNAQMGNPQRMGWTQRQPYQQPYQQPQQGYPQQQPYQQQPVYPPQQQGRQMDPRQQPYPPQQPQFREQPYQQYPNGRRYPNQPQPGFQPGFGQQPYPQQNVPPHQRPGYYPLNGNSQSPYQQGFQYPQGNPPQGYGYTQPVQPAKRMPAITPETIAMIVLCGLLPVLFILGLVFPGLPVLKWVFVALAVISVAALWIKPVVASNVRLTFTGVYGALAIVALVSALTGTPPLDSTAGTNNPAANQGSQVTSQQSASNSVTNNVNPQGSNTLGSWTTEVPPPANTPVPESGLNGEAVEQLKSFFYFWSVNNQNNMITLCAPSWQRSVNEPTKALFAILQNRIPLEYEVEKISGTDNDTARTVTVVAQISKRNNSEPQKYRFQVIMKKEDGVWYVDPASLESNVIETTPAMSLNVTPEPPPTAMSADPDTVLYWNPDGGSYYHAVAECTISTKPKYLPFKGKFLYRDINVGEYANLQPCPDCGAPLREY